MIICRLQGGLGNQLFQYAAGRALALQHGVPLLLDLQSYKFDTLRNYELEPFKIEPILINKKIIWPKFLVGMKNKLQQKLPCLLPKGYYREPHFYYDINFERLPNQTYLSGYWQSERYFKLIRPQLLQELQLANPAKGQNLYFLNQIKKTQSVSLHIRRGDYVANEQANQAHGTCSLDYYYQAITFVSQQVDKPHFYIFSDDHGWARANLKIEHSVTYVEVNDAAHGAEDLRLMSHCQHHIIANSSFSWWGAWLNPYEEKIIVAPKQWFKDPVLQAQAQDLVPPHWIKY